MALHGIGGGSDQTYEFEAYAHLEWVGTMPGLTESCVDPIGQAAVLEYMSKRSGGASDQFITKVKKSLEDIEEIFMKVAGWTSHAVPYLSSLM